MPLTRTQQVFRDTLAQQTGLDRRFIGAWLLAEEGGQGGPASGYERKGYYNYLNIARTDTNLNAPGSHGSYFNDPVTAAVATADWIKGRGPITKSYGRAAPGIRRLLSTAGQGVNAQINALSSSGWASSGYNGGSTLRQLLGQTQGGAANKAGSVPAAPRTRASTATSTPAPAASMSPDVAGQRAALITQYLRDKNANPVDLALGLRALNQSAPQAAATPGSTPRAAVRAPTLAGGGSASQLVQTVKQRADTIDAKHLPYLWGGGHSGRVNAATATPLDCSGAVSAALGIDPRVSGQFERFGSPGRAPGGRGITIFANPHHVIMEIDGHFWGTSQANPGGGAGWIPRSQISDQYLSGFTARHLAASVHG